MGITLKEVQDKMAIALEKKKIADKAVQDARDALELARQARVEFQEKFG